MSDRDTGQAVRRAVVITGVVSAVSALMLELTLSLGEYRTEPVRIAAYLVIIAFAVDAWRRDHSVGLLTLGSAGVLCATSLVDGLANTHAGLGPGTTSGMAGLICVIYVATRKTNERGPVLATSFGIAVFGLLSVVLNEPPTYAAIGWLLVAIPGQALAVWLSLSMTERLQAHTAADAVRIRIQKALGTCSHILLTREDDRAIESALHALLDATEADYAYVDVNQIEPDGRVTWRIVHSVMSDRIPPGPSDFEDGDYDDMPFVADALGSGKPVTIMVSALPVTLRRRYEAEGVKAELAAPILVGDQWIGTIGFTDFYRDNEWSDLEIDALMRAGDMVGAFWTRERAYEGLEALALAKDRFVASVSHELRTPLTVVAGFSAELRDRYDELDESEVRDMVALIAAQSEEVGNLVEDLLTVERAATGNLSVKPADFDLNGAVAAVVATTPLHNKTVTQVSGDVMAHADALRTRQIVRNLLTNAGRYGGANIQIECESDGDTASVVVSDDGPGVESIDVEKIFDPYFRSRPEGGVPGSVGLGLSVARQLAHVMGGSLVYGRTRGWTRFTLTLPAAATSSRQPAGATEALAV